MSGDPVFLEFGRRPDEPGAIVRPGARREYPPGVLDRLTADAGEIVARYPQARSALLPLLHLTQAEDGCITPAGIAFCAGILDLTAAEVEKVSVDVGDDAIERTLDILRDMIARAGRPNVGLLLDAYHLQRWTWQGDPNAARVESRRPARAQCGQCRH